MAVHRLIPCICMLCVLSGTLDRGVLAQKPLSRVDIARIGKAATALVEVKAPHGFGSAFCIHPSGLFLTNAHVTKGDVTLILNPSLKTERTRTLPRSFAATTSSTWLCCGSMGSRTCQPCASAPTMSSRS